MSGKFVADIFPSDFAVVLAEACQLISEHDKKLSGREGQIQEQKKTLATFQHMIIGGAKFEEALIIYETHTLTEDQIHMLKVIEKSTKPFIFGYLSEVLLKKASNGSYQAVSTLLSEVMNANGGGAKDQKSFEKAKGLIIQMAEVNDEEV